MAKKVLITRDAESAKGTSEALLELGFMPIIAPLFEVEFMNPELPQLAFGKVILTSKNALRFCMNHVSYFAGSEFYVVGAKLTKLVKNCGFEVAESSKDVLQLLAYLNEKHEYLYLRGSRITYDFKPEFPLVSELVVYKTRPVHNFDNSILQISDVILVYSTHSAKMLMEKANSFNLFNVSVIAISEKAGRSLDSTKFKHIKIAKEPTEHAMLSELISLTHKEI